MRMAQWSKFIGAPSRNEFWEPQEGGAKPCHSKKLKIFMGRGSDSRLFFYCGRREPLGRLLPTSFTPRTGTLLSASQTFPLLGELPFRGDELTKAESWWIDFLPSLKGKVARRSRDGRVYSTNLYEKLLHLICSGGVFVYSVSGAVQMRVLL